MPGVTRARVRRRIHGDETHPRPPEDRRPRRTAYDFRQNGSDVKVLLAGAGTRWIGSTPIHGLPLSAGSLRVVFESAELGEQVGTTVQLEAGKRLSLHAEFTRATPAVRLR